jgi:hypothetical protein
MGILSACWAIAVVLNVSLLAKGSNQTENNKLQTTTAPDTEHQKSLFLVHLGPPKTATTTLQCTLSHLSPSLREDGYLYLGKHPIKFCERGMHHQQDQNFECLTMQSCRQKVLSNATWWVSIGETMLKNTNQHLILSDELFSQSNQRMFLLKLLSMARRTHRVQILLTYRHYHEWLASMYHEMDRMGPHHHRLTEWNGREAHSLEWYLQRDVDTWIVPNVWSMKQDFLTQKYPIQVLSIHSPDFVKDLVCEHLQAQKTCSLLASRQAPSRFNPSVASESSDYDRLAMEAAKREWIDIRFASRMDAAKFLLQKLQQANQNGSLPLKCPSENLFGKLAKRSLLYTNLVFEQSVRISSLEGEGTWKSNYCSMDVEKILTEYGKKLLEGIL